MLLTKFTKKTYTINDFNEFFLSVCVGGICDITRKKKTVDISKYCISYSTNTLGKGMNPIILPPSMDK